MRAFITLIGLVLLCAAIYAGNNTTTAPRGNFSSSLEVSQKVSGSASAALGETVSVTISILNRGSSGVSVVVEKGLGNAVPVSPLPIYANITDEYHGARSPYLSWSLDVPPGQTKEATYQVKSKTVGLLNLGPAAVKTGDGVAYSNSVSVDVACTNSSTCDESAGETPLTCPHKCAGGNESAPDFQPVLIPTQIANTSAEEMMDEIAEEERKFADDKNNQLLIFAAVVIVVAAVAAYMLFLRNKGGPKPEQKAYSGFRGRQ